MRLIREEEAPRPSVRLSSSEHLPKIAAARKTEPARLPRLVRGELDWIVMKCLEKDRTRRYETASGLARDVERYLADEPVEAVRPARATGCGRSARKYRTPLRVAGAFLLLLVAGVIASTWQAIRATVAERGGREPQARGRRGRGQAEQRRDELAAVNDNLRRANYVADMNLARVAWDENNLGRAHELLEKHRPRPGEADLRGFEWHYLRRLFQSDLLTVKAHPGEVRPSPSRRTASGWSRPGRPARSRRFRPEARRCEVLGCGDRPAASTSRSAGPADKVAERSSAPTVPISPRLSGIRRSWSGTWPRAGSSRWKGPAKVPAQRVAFSPDGERLACSYRPDATLRIKDSPRSIRIWDLATRQAVVTIDRLPSGMEAPSFSPDGKLLAALEPDGGSRQGVGCGDGSRGLLLQIHRRRVVLDAAFSPDGKRLAACGTRGFASGTWPAARRRPPGRPIPGPTVPGLQPGRQAPGDGVREGMVEAVGHRRRSEGPDLQGALRTRHAIAFSPDGTRLATGVPTAPCASGTRPRGGNRLRPQGRAVSLETPCSAPTARPS